RQLLNAANEYMSDVIEAALATGMRRGEIRSLQWRQVEGLSIDVGGRVRVLWTPRAEIVLPAEKTKTRMPRRLPISERLKPILARRRFDPNDSPMPLDAYVFGNAVGEPIHNVTFTYRWHVAVLKAYGFKRIFKANKMDPRCRAELKQINLHFHDLRREAASRWYEAGVPLHVVRDWLGHTSIQQTSTYLATLLSGRHDAMRQFDEGRGYVPNSRGSLSNASTTPAVAATGDPSGHTERRANSPQEHLVS